MAKQGMKRLDRQHPEDRAPHVPEIQGKAKTGKKNVRPLIAGIPGAENKVYHTKPFAAIDNDLALENLEDHWDMTLADRQDFGGGMF